MNTDNLRVKWIEVEASVLEAQQARIAELQAKYDALMLEFCPYGMTADRLQEWGMNQVPESQLAELRQGVEVVSSGPCHRELISGLQSFLDRLIKHSETGVIHPELYEADADTLRHAISEIRRYDRMNKRNATRPQPAIPPGYAVVQINPCDAMRYAGEEALENSKWETGFAKVLDVWNAMLAAAPPVPVAEKVDYSPPFDNCRYKLCDLPGQCRSEGKCHHPAAPADSKEGE